MHESSKRHCKHLPLQWSSQCELKGMLVMMRPTYCTATASKFIWTSQLRRWNSTIQRTKWLLWWPHRLRKTHIHSIKSRHFKKQRRLSSWTSLLMAQTLASLPISMHRWVKLLNCSLKDNLYLSCHFYYKESPIFKLIWSRSPARL